MYEVNFPMQNANWENVIVLKLFLEISLRLIRMYLNENKTHTWKKTKKTNVNPCQHFPVYSTV